MPPLPPLLASALTIGALMFIMPSAAAQGHIDPRTIDAALSELVEAKALVGVSALVYQSGHEVYSGAFGDADREAHRPMTRDTIVHIRSMTKPIAGVALMTFYESGKFKLDDPLSKFLPEFANMKVYAGLDRKGEVVYEPANRPITIRDIVRHTAGLSDGMDQTAAGEIYRAADPSNQRNTLAEEASKLAALPLAYQPGARWLYSAGVDLQALLVERFCGLRFDRCLERVIFAPLRMRDTRYVIRPDDSRRLAAVYESHPDGTMTRIPDATAHEFNSRDWPLKSGSSGLLSTLDDYMRFARMLQNGGELDGVRILKPETIRLMATDAMPCGVTDISWLPTKGQVGFGIDFAVRLRAPADATENSGAVGEFFWDGAENTLFWVDPKHKITAVLFTQYVPFGKVPLHKAFRDAVYDDFPDALAK